MVGGAGAGVEVVVGASLVDVGVDEVVGATSFVEVGVGTGVDEVVITVGTGATAMTEVGAATLVELELATGEVELAAAELERGRQVPRRTLRDVRRAMGASAMKGAAAAAGPAWRATTAWWWLLRPWCPPTERAEAEMAREARRMVFVIASILSD